VKLTDAQRAAIAHCGGNLQLIACAGSGKTEVVAQRVAALLSPNPGPALLPANIVAFTFTEKAAAELKDRIVARCREQLGEVVGLAEMYVGTIHAFALDLLKGEVPEYLKYEVLNEVQQHLFVDRHSRESGLTVATDLNGAQLRRYQDTERYVDALNILREDDGWDETSLAANPILAGLDAYRNLLARKGYLDYSALLDIAVARLTNDEELKARIAERVKHVIVDEYQDVNPIQEALVWLLSELGADLTVVGDDDQTIYQWRGSAVRNILEFANHYEDVTTVPLVENFRSSRGIVETAREVIARNSVRLPKEMQPAGAQDDEPGDLVALTFADPDEEARFIAETCREVRGLAIREDGGERGISWSDMAVLLRSVKANGAPVTKALRAAGIPFVVIGMNDLFGAPEAEAARQLFYLMAGRIDAASATRAWEDAALGLDPELLAAAITAAARAGDEMRGAGEQRWRDYNLQRRFLGFLEEAGLREETVPGGRGEVVFYNLGKFSQLISDFESIHFHSKPAEKYESFAGFLEHRAESSYPEGWQENQYASPDAVKVMTVHQAKGMQWPVVFLPALLKNRFPAKRQGGRTVWHLLPAAAFRDQARYLGSIEDERRLFYVALTRSQKLLFCTSAPVPGNQLYQRASEFLDDVRASRWVKRRRQDYATRRRRTPAPKAGVANVVLTFSDLKYFSECPYQFKLRILYGFNPPLDEAIGYGKSLHDALAEVHARALRGDVALPEEAARLVATHLHAPYAYPELKAKLTEAAERVVADYLRDNRDLLTKLEHFEKKIDLHLGDGVAVTGRIDLIRRLDTGDVSIVDLKSKARVQAEDVTEAQLHIYALGYEELTGRRADFVEIYDLEERRRKPRPVDEEFIAETKGRVVEAATALRSGTMPPRPESIKCGACDHRRMCSAGAAATG